MAHAIDLPGKTAVVTGASRGLGLTYNAGPWPRMVPPSAASTTGLRKVRFPSPVTVGAKIRMLSRVARVEEVGGGVQKAPTFTVECDESAEPACVAHAPYRHYA